MRSDDGMNDKMELHNFINLLEKFVCKRIGKKDMEHEIRDRFKKESDIRKNEISYIASFSTWKGDWKAVFDNAWASFRCP